MKGDLVPQQLSLNIFGDKFEAFPNGLIVHGKPTDGEYDEAFKRLSRVCVYHVKSSRRQE